MKAVVGQDAAQVVVADKGDTVEIERFTLEPVHALPHAGQSNRPKGNSSSSAKTRTRKRQLWQRQQVHVTAAKRRPARCRRRRSNNRHHTGRSSLRNEIRLIAQCWSSRQIVGGTDLDGYFTQRKLERLSACRRNASAGFG
jgi:hypothetical protein